MTGRQKKGKRFMVVFFYLVSSVVFTGCGVQNNASIKETQKFLSMSLNQQPEYQPLLTGEPQTC